MNSKKTNKNIVTAILALALMLVCAASIVSCNSRSEDTMFPEYTGDIWTLLPPDGMTVEEGHIDPDTNDNIIDAGFFTTPVSEDDTASDGEIEETTDVADGDPSSAESDSVTTPHVVGPYDGVHNWPSDEFDMSGYHTLTPVD